MQAAINLSIPEKYLTGGHSVDMSWLTTMGFKFHHTRTNPVEFVYVLDLAGMVPCYATR